MTRKRLIKLLMSCYLQRNEAEAIAWEINALGIPYLEWWKRRGWRLRAHRSLKSQHYRLNMDIRRAFGNLETSFAVLSAAVQRVSLTFAQFVSDTLHLIQ